MFGKISSYSKYDGVKGEYFLLNAPWLSISDWIVNKNIFKCKDKGWGLRNSVLR